MIDIGTVPAGFTVISMRRYRLGDEYLVARHGHSEWLGERELDDLLSAGDRALVRRRDEVAIRLARLDAIG